MRNFQHKQLLSVITLCGGYSSSYQRLEHRLFFIAFQMGENGLANSGDNYQIYLKKF